VAHHAESDDVAGIALFSGAAWNELDEVDAVPLLNAGRLDSGSGLQATGEAKLSFKAEPYNAEHSGASLRASGSRRLRTGAFGYTFALMPPPIAAAKATNSVKFLTVFWNLTGSNLYLFNR